jgi:hypothetical protein
LRQPAGRRDGDKRSDRDSGLFSMHATCEYIFAGCNRTVGALDWSQHAGHLVAYAAASQALIYDLEVRFSLHPPFVMQSKTFLPRCLALQHSSVAYGQRHPREVLLATPAALVPGSRDVRYKER